MKPDMIKSVIDQIGLTWKLLFDKRVPFWMKLVAILPLVYVLSPIDLIPDMILGLGQLDDLGILLAGMRLFESIVPKDIVDEHRGELKARNNDNVINAPNYSVRQADKEKVQ